MKKVLVFFALMVIGTGLTYTGYNEWQDSKKLAREGKSTVGKVKAHHTHKSRRSSRKYHLVVAFEAENQQARTETIRVNSDVYYSGKASGTVPVHYLPADPDVLQAGPKVEIEYGSLLLGLLFIGFGLGTLALNMGRAVSYRGKTNSIGQGVQSERKEPAGQDGGATMIRLHQDVSKDHAQ